MKNILITGSSGFIGSHLVEHIDNLDYDHIYCVSRRMGPPGENVNGKIQYIQADLLDRSSYAPYLADCDSVVHLAAATGKKIKDEYYEINTKGTEILIEQCKLAGVNKILFVSTIAVKYPDKYHYDYALSKIEAEKAVQSSGLKYAIVRPTIVVGAKSPLWNNLFRMAKVRVIPYFGNGSTKIQPIHVEDLVDCMVSILDNDLFTNQLYELGGPDTVTFDEFMNAIHFEYTGKYPRIFHIPYKPLRAILAMLEGIFYQFLPVTVGQLSTFNNDGIIQPNELYRKYVDRMKTVREMLQQLVKRETEKNDNRILQQECRVFTRYLVGEAPTEYVVEKYIEAHAELGVFNGNRAEPFDHFLVQVATRNRLFVRMVDSYASIFYKNSLLRKKLTLLLAILESCVPFSRHFETPDSTNIFGISINIILRGLLFSITFLLGSILLVPARIIISRRSKPVTEVGESWAR